MATQNNKNSIREQLEGIAQRKSHDTNSQKAQARQSVDNTPKKHQSLQLNWKDAVIFSFTMVIGLMYNINVHAQQPGGEAVNFDDIASGMMLSFNKANGEYRSLTLDNTSFDVDVYGLLATITVKQQFTNHNPDWITEGVYAYPLADMSALYRLKMTIGDRMIEGEIHEKKQAEQIYQQAKAEGLTATMVKQHRPNIFTSDIANIAPFESITIELTYQQSLRYDNGYFELQLPMSIKPRYVPADYDARLPMHSNVTDSLQRQIKVHLDAGFEVDEIRSLYHEVHIASDFKNHVVRLEDSQLYDSHDFVMRWYPVLGDAPKAALFSEVKGGYEYSLLMVMPPKATAKVTQARNITFIMDTSGSMHGKALAQAKDALLFSLSELTADNYFNVIDFDSTAKALFSQSMPATPENIMRALDFVDGFSSDGGTNMAPALQIAMQDSNIKAEMLNQIIFLTDGSVGNEAAIFDQIAKNIGDARLFTIAIGVAPNNYFMNKAAMFGRGSYTQIADLNLVDESMRDVFNKLASPAMTDVDVAWQATKAEQSPKVIPDLYLGQPLIVTTKTPLKDKLGGNEFTVSGITHHDEGNKSWSEGMKLSHDGRTEGIARLWARNQVEDWMDDLMLGGNRDILKQSITELALNHGLVTEFTSLVAVDKTPNLSRQAQAKAAQKRYAESLAYPQGSLGIKGQMLFGMLMILIAGWLQRRTQMQHKL
ncbi:VIT domain-containing protein [Marinicella rhabdoformis]|uniref:VIT domain-containing protein n=1 Tax=Marinicella rhabdoformis TaxID=2580566 RepID=UPI0012AEDA95|nr:VIT domain-containing protein [Marinicella rhabdoformis]